MDELAFLTATEQAELVRRGEVTPVELVETYLERIERLNPELNAFVTVCGDEALAAAAGELPDGPFRGVPIPIKDLQETAGIRTTFSSRAYADYVPNFDVAVVRRLKEAGFVVIGKTNTPELGSIGMTESELNGDCRNPWDTTRTPGGSSGGAAAALAAGLCPVAQGSDGGGSIRIPASCCGLFGLKPSRGRQPSNTVPAPGDLGIDHAVSRSVRDSALLLDLTSGNAGRPMGAPGTFLAAAGEPCMPLHIAFVTDPMLAPALSADARAALDDAAQLAASLGHHIEPVSLGIDFASLREAFLMIWSVSAENLVLRADQITGRKPNREEFEIATWTMGHIGRKFGERELPAALEAQRQVSAKLADLMTRYDVILCATLASAPIKIGEMQPTAVEKMQMRAVTTVPVEPLMRKLLTEVSNKAFAWAGCTELFNLTGQPAMSVPLYWNARGLPIGVQFATRDGGEATLLRLAAQLETARPWFDRRPPLMPARS